MNIDIVNRPDHDIELFWLGFKQSMLNFYDLKLIPQRSITIWSDKLNNLQKQEKYGDIEKQIYNYITLYGIDLLRTENRYHLNILFTNLKRWDKLSEKYQILMESNTHGEYKDNLITIFIIIATNFIKTDMEFNGLFKDIELYLIYEDYTNLIDFSVKYNKPIIIDRLWPYHAIAVNNAFKTLYNIEFASGTSGKKILEILHAKLGINIIKSPKLTRAN